MEPELKRVEHSLETLNARMWQISKTLDSFKPGAQPVLDNLMEEFFQDIKKVDKSALQTQATIPGYVIDNVNKGINPDEYNQIFFKDCVERNELTRGRLYAAKGLRDQLMIRREIWRSHEALTQQQQQQQKDNYNAINTEMSTD